MLLLQNLGTKHWLEAFMLHNSAFVRIDVWVEENQVLTLPSSNRRTIFQPCSMAHMTMFQRHTAAASGETVCQAYLPIDVCPLRHLAP
jgi:hypothetical protein